MLTDPIADMLTRIRNANKAMLDTAEMPTSRIKEEIARVLLGTRATSRTSASSRSRASRTRPSSSSSSSAATASA